MRANVNTSSNKHKLIKVSQQIPRKVNSKGYSVHKRKRIPDGIAKMQDVMTTGTVKLQNFAERNLTIERDPMFMD